MPSVLAASLLDAARQDGGPELRMARLEAASLRIAFGPLALELDQVVLHDVVGQVHVGAGAPRLDALRAERAELSGVTLRAPLVPARQAQAGSHWRLDPLASANGSLQARIVDAHLLFDADVTVPVRQGKVSFKDATVEHVGPDSRMGASRMGIYVDAPNGRSYLYQFANAPVAGVEFEQRGVGLGLRVSERGSLQLQPFAEGLLGGAQGLGVTEQARLMLDRTALSGELRLGDGAFAAPGLQAELLGRAEGRNAVRVHSEAVGRGVTAEVEALSVRKLALALGQAQLACEDIAASARLRVDTDGGQLRCEIVLPNCKITGLRLRMAG